MDLFDGIEFAPELQNWSFDFSSKLSFDNKGEYNDFVKPEIHDSSQNKIKQKRYNIN